MGRFSRNILVSLVVVSAVFALAAASASASVITDCNDNGAIDGKYSPSQLKNALGNIPADVDQYSDCRSLIQQALLNSFAKKNKGGGSGSNNSASLAQVVGKSDRKSVERKVKRATRRTAGAAVADLAGANIDRSGARTLASSAAPGTPAAPLIALFGVILLLAAGPVGRLAKRPAVKRLLPSSGRGDGTRP